MKIQKTPQTAKKWPKYCLIAAVASLVLCIVLYFVQCFMINSEFAFLKDYYGETFDELYSINMEDSSLTDPIVKQGRAALKFIGTEDECDDFGLLSRYCTDLAFYPNAVRATGEMKLITAAVKGNSGYLWVAYYQRVYDADGNLCRGSGSKDERILSRWTIEKQNGVWTVTKIWEHP